MAGIEAVMVAHISESKAISGSSVSMPAFQGMLKSATIMRASTHSYCDT